MAEGGARLDEPEGFPKQGSVSSHQTLCENASIETSSVMNWLGYGPEIRQARIDAYREICRLMTALCRGAITLIITGSKAEGLSRLYESDMDIMVVMNRVICLEDGVNANNFPSEMTMLRSYSLMSYAGHCRLLLERRGTMVDTIVDDSFCDDGYGRELLSSDIFVNNLSKIKHGAHVVQHDRAGPSIPTSLRGVHHNDMVCALRYYCPNILSKWAARPRHWPPAEVVQHVVSLGAFLTPVGFKGSEYQHVEWRVCFNAGEIEIVNNLNTTQINLYVLLKMVKNDVLNPRKKEVSSYTLKNIVLWIAENNPQSLFHERSLLHWLLEGLNALRVALVTRELPYYMIPDRNLMAASGLEEEQRCTWISTISEMLNEGPRMILRLPKIRQGIVAHPEPFRWYNGKRIEFEMLLLMGLMRAFLMDENLVPDQSDVTMLAIKRRSDEIAAVVYLRMIFEGSRDINMQDVWNGMLM
ncbi:hypothetical protein DPMN_028532 [Dreissena polymorpha]|uniref:Mab-21-like HhH/H2TH-like domain-containing protein n=1 Tax=Dreissena polymorpha TaxID=45954 RepID=A0A9D4LVL3_DREPO|nr:hypothetical protein DPMN_028532 [Dreissena polymorpha]